jgi:hypothetical protein
MAERLTWNKPAWVAGIEPQEGPLFVITDGQGRYAFHRTVPQDDRFFLHCIADPALAERTLADKRRDIDPALRLEQLDFEAARGIALQKSHEGMPSWGLAVFVPGRDDPSLFWTR